MQLEYSQYFPLIQTKGHLNLTNSNSSSNKRLTGPSKYGNNYDYPEYLKLKKIGTNKATVPPTVKEAIPQKIDYTPIKQKLFLQAERPKREYSYKIKSERELNTAISPLKDSLSLKNISSVNLCNDNREVLKEIVCQEEPIIDIVTNRQLLSIPRVLQLERWPRYEEGCFSNQLSSIKRPKEGFQ